ncbi:hypothetical protein C2845_PM17G09960 [Panicum miliaceum]|uniref:Uncharacterized protein n=1 Tax=Panicum miliaceum TaxID=4540 RepID=A0A3L6Q3X8_PANMI|nr:hypothetical protein C2845_PM17G09960 [Panicum miliaceum]
MRPYNAATTLSTAASMTLEELESQSNQKRLRGNGWHSWQRMRLQRTHGFIICMRCGKSGVQHIMRVGQRRHHDLCEM